jgi:NADPH:quinone reductase
MQIMKAIVIEKPGGPEVLKLFDRPVPTANENDLLIQVFAAGVNRPDIMQRQGNYPPPPGASPDIPGLEVAGIVVKRGPACTRFKEGDRVCALVTGGGYAEYCAVPEGQCLPIPGTLSFSEAASLPETYFTVWSNVFERGRLLKGETLLVHGGTSGIGVTAIQLAKTWGAVVYATAGSEKKCEACEQLGANIAINYKTKKFKEELKKICPEGVNVILDIVGGAYTPDNIEILAEDGRLVLISAVLGDQTTIRLWPVIRKRLTITGSTLRARDTDFKKAIARLLEDIVWPWLADGKIKPVIYKTFPLQKASEAHEMLETSEHIGKIILTVRA